MFDSVTRIIVILRERILHYVVRGEFENLEMTHQIQTGDNPLGANNPLHEPPNNFFSPNPGLCAVSRTMSGIFACTSPGKTDILLHNCSQGRPEEKSAMRAHKTPITCMAMLDDAIVASASDVAIISRIPKLTFSLVLLKVRGLKRKCPFFETECFMKRAFSLPAANCPPSYFLEREKCLIFYCQGIKVRVWRVNDRSRSEQILTRGFQDPNKQFFLFETQTKFLNTKVNFETQTKLFS